MLGVASAISGTLATCEPGLMGRYGKRDDLIVHESEPFNAETGLASLGTPVTATDAFYVRGHGTIPQVARESWRLQVGGLVERQLSLSFETLREAFRERTVTATLQCAGNRRAGLVAIRDIPGEAPWGPGATGTATWTGVALADVLALARPGAPPSARKSRPRSGSEGRSRSTRPRARRCCWRGR